MVDQGVDYVFVPRMVSVEKGKYFCPKFMGLPDMLEHGIPAARSKLLALEIQSNTEDITSPRLICLIAGKLGVSRSEFRRASHSSARRWKKFRNLCLEGKTIKKAWAELDGGAIGPRFSLSKRLREKLWNLPSSLTISILISGLTASFATVVRTAAR